MKKILVGLFLIVLMGSKTKASHTFGGEMTWKAVRDNNAQNFQRDGYGFIFILTAYRDCSGIALPLNNIPQIIVQGNPVDKSGRVISRIPLRQGPGVLGTGYEITPVCSGTTNIGRCGANNPLGGFTNVRGAVAAVQFWSDTVWLTGVPPRGGWLFQSDPNSNLCCRNSNQNSGCIGEFVVRSKMYPYFQKDSTGQNVGIPVQCLGDASPEFPEYPNSFLVYNFGRIDTSFIYFGAVDQDLDALNYSIDYPYTNLNSPCSYNNGFSISNPLPNIVPAYGIANYPIDTLSGIMGMAPRTQGNFLICIKVTTVKNGQKIAENFRDFQVVVLANYTGLGYSPIQSSPKISGKEVISGNNLVSGAKVERFFGDEIQLEVQASDYAPFTDSVTLKFSGHPFWGTYQDGVDTFRVDSGCYAPPCASIRAILPTSSSVILPDSLNGMPVGYGVKALNQVGYRIHWKTNCAQSVHPTSSCLKDPLPQHYSLNFIAKDNQCPFNGKNAFTMNLVLKEVDCPQPKIHPLSFSSTNIQLRFDSLVDVTTQETFDTSLQQSVFRRVNRFHGIQVYRDSCGAGWAPFVTLWKPSGLSDSAQLFWIQQLHWMDWNLSANSCPYRYVVHSIYGCDSLLSFPSDTASVLLLQGKEIPSIGKNGWILYPNPATTNVTFSNSNAQNLELMVYDSEGKLKLKKDFGVIHEGEFSVEGWPAGTYLAEIWNKKNGQKLLTSRIKFAVQ